MTQHELLDIVNEKDEIIGVASKEEIHEKILLHRFVHVFVETSEGKVVVQQRSRHKKKGPLKFDAAVGGHVKSGESYEAAAKREMIEELGVAPGIKLIGNTFNNGTTEHITGKLFIARSDGPFTFDAMETEKLLYLTPPELEELIAKERPVCCTAFVESTKVYLTYKQKELVGKK